MTDKRKVHDILSEAGIGPRGEKMQRRPVSFIQHGNLEDGFLYEGVCPFCGITTAYVPKAHVDATFGGLYRVLLKLQKEHWIKCTQWKTNDFAVEITNKPLNVEKLPVIN
jgi:hypothetical protein